MKSILQDSLDALRNNILTDYTGQEQARTHVTKRDSPNPSHNQSYDRMRQQDNFVAVPEDNPYFFVDLKGSAPLDSTPLDSTLEDFTPEDSTPSDSTLEDFTLLLIRAPASFGLLLQTKKSSVFQVPRGGEDLLQHIDEYLPHNPLKGSRVTRNNDPEIVSISFNDSSSKSSYSSSKAGPSAPALVLLLYSEDEEEDEEEPHREPNYDKGKGKGKAPVKATATKDEDELRREPNSNTNSNKGKDKSKAPAKATVSARDSDDN